MWLDISSDRTWTHRPPRANIFHTSNNSICSDPLKPPLWTVMNTERARRTVDRSLLFAQQIEGGKIGRLWLNTQIFRRGAISFADGYFLFQSLFRELMCFIALNAIWLFSLFLQDVAVVSVGLNHLFWGRVIRLKPKSTHLQPSPVSVAYLNLALCLQMKGPFVKQSWPFCQVNFKMKIEKKMLCWVEAGNAGVRTGCV